MSDEDEEELDLEPRCIECGCGLFTEEHAFDCSFVDDDEEEDE